MTGGGDVDEGLGEVQRTRELSRFEMARMATMLVMVSFVTLRLSLQGLCMTWPTVGWSPCMAMRGEGEESGNELHDEFLPHFKELRKWLCVVMGCCVADEWKNVVLNCRNGAGLCRTMLYASSTRGSTYRRHGVLEFPLSEVPVFG